MGRRNKRLFISHPNEREGVAEIIISWKGSFEGVCLAG